MPLRTLDLNLLKVFDALAAERSVTRAGDVLGRSQPAVSNALHRLRVLLNDDLFVRGRDGLAMTPRATELRTPIHDALQNLQKSLFETTPFDPAIAMDECRISTPDRLSLAVVPPLFGRLQDLAPNMSLRVATADREHALSLLDEDRTDVALCWIDGKPGHLKAELLLEEHFFCVYRKGHPLGRPRGRFDLAAVLSFPHIVVSAAGGRGAIFDVMLARLGLERKALVAVPNFTAAPHLLARSDMVGVFTRLAADVFEESFGLAKRQAPANIGKVATHMVWAARNDKDARHAWLREQIRIVYRGLR